MLGSDAVGMIGWMVNGGGVVIEYFDLYNMESMEGDDRWKESSAESMRFSIQQIIIIPFVEKSPKSTTLVHIFQQHPHTHTHTIHI